MNGERRAGDQLPHPERLGSCAVGDTQLVASAEDVAIVERLRAGDESAFIALVDRHQAPMLRLARIFVGSQAVAEEVVQDAWVGILRGLERFEGRSSLRT